MSQMKGYAFFKGVIEAFMLWYILWSDGRKHAGLVVIAFKMWERKFSEASFILSLPAG